MKILLLIACLYLPILSSAQEEVIVFVSSTADEYELAEDKARMALMQFIHKNLKSSDILRGQQMLLNLHFLDSQVAKVELIKSSNPQLADKVEPILGKFDWQMPAEIPCPSNMLLQLSFSGKAD